MRIALCQAEISKYEAFVQKFLLPSIFFEIGYFHPACYVRPTQITPPVDGQSRILTRKSYREFIYLAGFH
jgi:hypothetical protein